MEDDKQVAGNFSGWVRGTEKVTKDCVFINGQESYPLHAGDENWIDCNSEEIARRIVACVNACAGLDTYYLENVGLPEFAGKTLCADLAQQELDAVTAQRDQLKASLDKIVDKSVELEQQRDQLLGALEGFDKAMEEASDWPDTSTEREILSRAVTAARAVIAAVRGAQQ